MPIVVADQTLPLRLIQECVNALGAIVSKGLPKQPADCPVFRFGHGCDLFRHVGYAIALWNSFPTYERVGAYSSRSGCAESVGGYPNILMLKIIPPNTNTEATAMATQCIARSFGLISA